MKMMGENRRAEWKGRIKDNSQVLLMSFTKKEQRRPFKRVPTYYILIYHVLENSCNLIPLIIKNSALLKLENFLNFISTIHLTSEQHN